MRSRLISITFVVIVLAAVAIVRFKQSRPASALVEGPPPTAEQMPSMRSADPVPTKQPKELDRSPTAPVPSRETASVPATPTTPATNATISEAALREKLAALSGLVETGDDASLQSILVELQHPAREVRKAALQATLDFGSRDAIPKLKEAAALAEEPREKADLLEAADYLALPTLTEVRQKKKAEAKARATSPSPTGGSPTPAPIEPNR